MIRETRYMRIQEESKEKKMTETIQRLQFTLLHLHQVQESTRIIRRRVTTPIEGATQEECMEKP